MTALPDDTRIVVQVQGTGGGRSVVLLSLGTLRTRPELLDALRRALQVAGRLPGVAGVARPPRSPAQRPH